MCHTNGTFFLVVDYNNSQPSKQGRGCFESLLRQLRTYAECLLSLDKMLNYLSYHKNDKFCFDYNKDII
jgi:hypothetical protein